MPVMPPVDHLLSLPRAPRAQFFANRAVSHARSLTSFDDIIDQLLIERIVSGNHPAQAQRTSEIESLLGSVV